MQTLTLKKALPIVRRAYEKKTLGAFLKIGNCKYDYGDDFHHCAIGKCLTPDSIRRVFQANLNSESLPALFGNILKVPEEDQKPLIALQIMHDRWGFDRPLDHLYELPMLESLGFTTVERYITETTFGEFLTFLEQKVATQ